MICDADENVVYHPKKILGRGRHGVFHVATYYGSDCVAKVINHYIEEKSFLKEIDMVKKLKHPNIIEVLDICPKLDMPKLPIVIISKMSMSLAKFLQKSSDKAFVYVKVCILDNITCGLHYLHAKNIIHCDLTVNAILLTEDFCAKIADFGQAKEYNKSQLSTLEPLEYSHMSPEAITEKPKYSMKLDIFSFGCVMIQVITNQFPIPYFNKKRQLPDGSYVDMSEVERRQEHMDKIAGSELSQLHVIVEKCLQDNPEDRPTISMLLPLIRTHKADLSETPESILTKKSKVDLVTTLKNVLVCNHHLPSSFAAKHRLDGFDEKVKCKVETEQCKQYHPDLLIEKHGLDDHDNLEQEKEFEQQSSSSLTEKHKFNDNSKREVHGYNKQVDDYNKEEVNGYSKQEVEKQTEKKESTGNTMTTGEYYINNYCSSQLDIFM